MNQNQERPGFHPWEKWLLMSIIILCLSAIVIYFNLTVFGLSDGAPYIGVVLFIVILSFLITAHIKWHPVTTGFLRAAFLFEVLLCAALGVNVAYSLSVQREMSIAGLTEQTRKDTIAEISKLRGQRNQRQALRYAGVNEKEQARTRDSVFKEKERVLFWIMMGELGIGLLGTFVLLGLSTFGKDKVQAVPQTADKAEWEAGQLRPGLVRHNPSGSAPRPPMQPSPVTASSTQTSPKPRRVGFFRQRTPAGNPSPVTAQDQTDPK